MNYRGYVGSVEFSDADKCFFGKILNVQDLILYEGKDTAELERNFCEAVDDYIDFLSERG